jgi:hypothetical protein
MVIYGDKNRDSASSNAALTGVNSLEEGIWAKMKSWFQGNF